MSPIDMEPIGMVVGGVALVAILVFSLIWRGSRSDSMLQEWAEANDLTILSREYRTLFKGPYFWTSGKGQMVHYVTVQDPQGRTRHAWVRCGGYWLGMISDNVDVEWED